MDKAKPKNWVRGRWLIESMDEWDREFIDEEVRGYFEFDARDSGDFQFGYVHGDIDYRLGERDGKPPSNSLGSAMMRWTGSRAWVVMFSMATN